mgnify:CR=1 FL=1
MRHHLSRFGLAAVLLAATPLVASAATVTGPYISGGAGYDLTQSQHLHLSPGADGLNTGASGSAVMRHQNGYTGFMSTGYGFGNGLRAEVEGDYFYSQINHLSNRAAVGKTGGGDRSYGVLVNALYDIDLQRLFGIDSPVTPYVGVGAGYLWSGYHNSATHFANGQTTGWGGNRGSFAYQGIVGLSYDVRDVPGLAVTADYRMVGQDFYNGTLTSHTAAGVGHVNTDPRFNHQFTIGLRYAFNAAPAAPAEAVAPVAAVPVPSPARSYLIFFDWDSSQLSARAQSIIGRAASAAQDIKVTRIHVNGYTDNSAAHPGPRGEAFNQALSLRRANAVKTELVKDGVSSDAISIQGHGDKNPLVETGPNTREPQHRRVEIILD